MKQPCDLTDVHIGMMVLLVFVQHSDNIFYRKTHIYQEICRNIPRTIDLLFLIRTDFSLYAFHIINPCKDHRVESRNTLPVDIISTKLCKKIQENLVVRSTVHLIDKQDDRFGGLSADIA